MLPGRVIHADWSANPRKRWQVEAVLGADECYTAYAPQEVRDPGLLALTLMSYANGGVLVGFDFPIGVPLAYARKVGIDDFLSALPQFGQGDWAEFYNVAEYADQISLRRPFYPARPRGKQKSDLTDALGIADLHRQCDLKTEDRNAAAELFWTMGAQQVGKAAISGWQEILTPGAEHAGVSEAG